MKDYLEEIATARFMNGMISPEKGESPLRIKISDNAPINFPVIANAIFDGAQNLKKNPFHDIQPEQDTLMSDQDALITDQALSLIREQVNAAKQAGKPITVIASYSDFNDSNSTVSFDEESAAPFINGSFSMLSHIQKHTEELNQDLTPTQELMRKIGVSAIGNTLSIPSMPSDKNSRIANLYPRSEINLHDGFEDDQKAVNRIINGNIKTTPLTSNASLLAISSARHAPHVGDVTNKEAATALMVIFKAERPKMSRHNAMTGSNLLLKKAVRPIEQAIDDFNAQHGALEASASSLDNDNPLIADALKNLEELSPENLLDLAHKGDAFRYTQQQEPSQLQSQSMSM